ncbi:hypothetical protein FACS189429_0060 [Bacteroidia bacterium]|nr:hypothetical protein FACS189429_0060 [Bacteroidia bacterium]
MKKILFINIFLICLSVNAFSQFGIRVGVNSADEVRQFVNEPENFDATKLTSFHAGIVWQTPFGKSGFATEIGALFSQKGSYYNYTNSEGIDVQAIDELNYIEVPLNIRFSPPGNLPLNIYGTAGIYFSYLFNGKTTDEKAEKTVDMNLTRIAERLDIGLATGAGVQLFKKIQLGATWNWGLKYTPHLTASDIVKNFKNKGFSVNLTYVF